MGAIKRKCDNCGKEYNADTRNLRRGWGVIEEITDQTGYYGGIYRFCYCAAQMALEKITPGRNRYAGGSVRSNRERFLVMRYCKGRLKIGYFTHPAKMISQNKDYFFGN